MAFEFSTNLQGQRSSTYSTVLVSLTDQQPGPLPLLFFSFTSYLHSYLSNSCLLQFYLLVYLFLQFIHYHPLLTQFHTSLILPLSTTTNYIRHQLLLLFHNTNLLITLILILFSNLTSMKGPSSTAPSQLVISF